MSGHGRAPFRARHEHELRGAEPGAEQGSTAAHGRDLPLSARLEPARAPSCNALPRGSGRRGLEGKVHGGKASAPPCRQPPLTSLIATIKTKRKRNPISPRAAGAALFELWNKSTARRNGRRPIWSGARSPRAPRPRRLLCCVPLDRDLRARSAPCNFHPRWEKSKDKMRNVP